MATQTIVGGLEAGDYFTLEAQKGEKHGHMLIAGTEAVREGFLSYQGEVVNALNLKTQRLCLVPYETKVMRHDDIPNTRWEVSGPSAP